MKTGRAFSLSWLNPLGKRARKPLRKWTRKVTDRAREARIVVGHFLSTLLNLWPTRSIQKAQHILSTRVPWFKSILFGIVLIVIAVRIALWMSWPWPAMWKEIPVAILVSTGRLIITMALSLAWVIPVTLLVWNRAGIRQNLTTLAQIGASLPATALFPLIILLLIKKVGGGMEIASVMLLLSGMQWYLLLNCLSGTAIIPGDLKEATRSFGLKNIRLWRRLVLPAIRPALVTGALTAWGGGWNALVMAEYVQYRGETHSVQGIGALMNRAVYEMGDSRIIFLCVGAMVVWIIVLNITFWRPVYKTALERYRFET